MTSQIYRYTGSFCPKVEPVVLYIFIVSLELSVNNMQIQLDLGKQVSLLRLNFIIVVFVNERLQNNKCIYL